MRDIPSLEAMLGEAAHPRPPMSADEIERNLAAWEAATAHLGQSEETPDA